MIGVNEMNPRFEKFLHEKHFDNNYAFLPKWKKCNKVRMAFSQYSPFLIHH